MEKTAYRQAVEYLLNIPQHAKKNSFENTKFFLKRLGNYEQMERVIHVAGTNGKGSVCNYLQMILMEAGFTVGMFTSPHLVCVNERIRIQGESVADEEFAHAFWRVKRCVDQLLKEGRPHPAFFEFIFAMACVIFEEKTLDFIILETGLGGRLDATNIVKKPILTVITSIGLDHTEYLGDAIEQIAAEKAGIIKHGAPLVYDASLPQVNKVIEKYATKFQVSRCPVSDKNTKLKKFTNKDIDFLYQYGYDRSICLKLHTGAHYQVINAALAIESAKQLNCHIEDSIIKKGIARAKWSGRMEWKKPFFLLDGAHNAAGVQAAAKSVASMNKKVILLFSAVSDKNLRQMTQLLCETLPIAEIIITQLSLSRAAQAEELRNLFYISYKSAKPELAKSAKERIYLEKDVEQAVRLAIEHRDAYQDPEVIIFATGSLYLIGDICAIRQV